MMLAENIWLDPQHWLFELFNQVVVDGLLIWLVWGKVIKPHIHRDIRRGPEEGV
jgi:hypothetical protein